jgi:hypothetical protein
MKPFFPSTDNQICPAHGFDMAQPHKRKRVHSKSTLMMDACLIYIFDIAFGAVYASRPVILNILQRGLPYSTPKPYTRLLGSLQDLETGDATKNPSPELLSHAWLIS